MYTTKNNFMGQLIAFLSLHNFPYLFALRVEEICKLKLMFIFLKSLKLCSTKDKFTFKV